MFKGSRRGNYAATLSKPVVIHRIGKPQHVSKAEILRFLDDFIVSKESFIDNNSNSNSNNVNSGKNVDSVVTTGGASDIVLNIDTNLTSSLSQLKRIQRDFKGLPPQSAVLSTIKIDSKDTKNTDSENNEQQQGDKITKSATGGTKKTFAD